MKAYYKKLSTGSIVLFMAGIIAAAYYLYTVPENIANALNIHEISQVNQINAAFRQTTFLIGLELSLGLLAIILMLLEKQHTTSYTVSDDATKDNKQNNTKIDQAPDSDIAFQQRIQIIESSLQSNLSDTKDKLEYALKEICRDLEACQGIFFIAKQKDQKHVIELFASYAFYFAESKSLVYEFGEGLAGQVAKEGKLVNIKSVPEGYVTILSGLGSSSPNHLIIAPVKQDDEILGVLEIASFKEFSKEDEYMLSEFSNLLGQQLSGKKRQQEDVRRVAYS